MLRSIFFVLCMFGCVPAPPAPAPPQYISGPLVPDPIRKHLPPRAPTDAEIKTKLDTLSRSLGDLQRTIDKDAE